MRRYALLTSYASKLSSITVRLPVNQDPDFQHYHSHLLMFNLSCARCLVGTSECVMLQALGESVIRRALEELQVWGLEKRFVMYTYNSTAGTR